MESLTQTAESVPAPELASRQFASGRNLARNTVWNFVGLAAPLPIALVTLPMLTSQLGPNRFGALALIWALIGYSSVFDLGLGRVLTKVVAEELGREQEQEVPSLVWTALLLLAALGFTSAVAFGLLVPWLVDDLLKIPQSLQAESRQALLLLTAFLPLLTTSSGLRGVLEAQHRFRVVSVVSVTTVTFTLLGPVLVLPYSRSLVAIVTVMLGGRIIAWLAYLLLCLRITPGMKRNFRPRSGLLGPMVRFGGWLTVSNIISPMMTYLDRFVVGSLLSIGAVGFYTVPYDLITKVSIVSSAVSGVAFPAFSASFAPDRARVERIFGWGTKALVITLAPLTLVVIIFAKDLLQLWLGADYARNSALVLQWLAIGVFINSMAQIPFVLIQAGGRPDLIAKLHAAELLPYLVTLWLLVGMHGIVGAAMAWTARATVDTLCLLWLAHRFVPQSTVLISQVAVAAGIAVLVGTQIPLSASFAVRSSILLAALVVLIPILWYFLLIPAERRLVEQYFDSFRSRLMDRAPAGIGIFRSVQNRRVPSTLREEIEKDQSVSGQV
jgi:O-antigen/teichoic acid export membrane protein